MTNIIRNGISNVGRRIILRLAFEFAQGATEGFVARHREISSEMDDENENYEPININKKKKKKRRKDHERQ
jgi:hypothetical protein